MLKKINHANAKRTRRILLGEVGCLALALIANLSFEMALLLLFMIFVTLIELAMILSVPLGFVLAVKEISEGKTIMIRIKRKNSKKLLF